MKRKLLSMILVLAMLTTLAPVGVFAEGEPAAVTEEDEVQAAPAPEPTAEPTPEPTQAPTPEPTQAPTPEPTQAPTEAPAQEPAAAPDPEPAEEPAPAAEPAAETAAAPAEEPVQEAAPASAAKSEPETKVSDPEPVRVDFRLTPDGAKLTVYTKDEKGNKDEIRPEKDGSFLLLPGRYFYTLTAEGFEGIEDKEFEVKASAKPVEVILELAPVTQPEEEEEVLPAEDGEEEADVPAPEEAAEPAEEPAAAEEPDEEPAAEEAPDAENAEETEEPAAEEAEPEDAGEDAEKADAPEEAEESEEAEEGATARNTADGAAAIVDLVLDTDYTVSLDYDNDIAYFRFIPEQTGKYVFQSIGSDQETYCTLSENGDEIHSGGGSYDFSFQDILYAGFRYTYAVQYDPAWTWDPGSFIVRLTKLPFSVVPVGDTYLSFAPGEIITLAVSVLDGDPSALSYQWYENGAPIDGADRPSLTMEAAYGDYEVYVTDGTTSQGIVFHVSINNDFSAWAADSEDQGTWLELHVAPESTAELKVAFQARDEESVSFEWYLRGWDPIEGADKAVYTTPPVESYTYYECYVYDTYGNSTWITFNVYVDNELSAYIAGTKRTSQNYTVDLADSLTLAVDVNAIDSEGLTITWYKDWENEEIEGEHEPVLNTGELTSSTEYECRVSDRFGNTAYVFFNIDVQLNFSAHVKGTSRTSATLTVQPGDTPVLEVEIEADDPDALTVEWTKDGEPVESAAGSTSLTADPVDSITYYYCTVSDRYGNYIDVYFDLLVENHFSAYIKGTRKTSTTLYAKPGDTPTLEVEITADDWEELTIEWEKDYQYLPDETDSSLVTDPITGRAYYQCYVCDRYGNYEYLDFTIFVDNGLSARVAGTDKNSIDIYVAPDGSAILEAEIYAEDMTNLSIEWEKDDRPIPGETGSSLSLTNITKAAEYTCRIYDGYGNSVYVFFDVYVDNGFAATMNGLSQEYIGINVKPGDTVTMKVAASANSGQIRYEWYCDGETLDFTGDTLTTDPVYRTMRYDCGVFDEYGNSQYFHVSVRVDNHLQARVGNTPNNYGRILVPYGDSTTLYVIASADEGELIYRWTAEYYDAGGHYIEEELDINSSSIDTIEITSPCRYTCTVTDIYGDNIWLEMNVMVDSGLTVRSGNTTDNNGNIAVTYNDTVTLKVIASVDSGNLYYEWYQIFYDDDDNFAGQVDLPDTGDSITTDAITGRAYYGCTVTDDYGGTAGVGFNVVVRNNLTVSRGNKTDDNDQIPVAQGQSIRLWVNASAETGDLKYQWYEEGYDRIPIDGATDFEFTTPAVTESKEYVCRVIDIYGTVKDVYFDVIVSNNLTAYVAGTTRSEADLDVDLSDRPVMKVEASAASGTLKYQWYIIRDPGNDWTWEEFNSTGTSCTAEPVERYTVYVCEVTDIYGGVARVWFNLYPANNLIAYVAGTTDDWADVYLELGEKPIMSVEASAASGDLSYHWQIIRDPHGERIWEDLDESGTSCTGESVEAYTEYVCEVTDMFGSTVSVWFYIYPNNDLTAYVAGTTRDWDELYVKYGDRPVMNVEASAASGDLSYRWSIIRDPEDGWTWEEYGAEGTSCTAEPVTQYTVYVCEVTDMYGSTVEVWFNVYVESDLTAYVAGTTDNWKNITVDPGKTATLSVTAKASTKVTYRWFISTYDSSGESSGYTQVPGATGSKLTTGKINNYTEYTCEVTDAYGSTARVWFNISVNNKFTAYAAGTKNTWVQLYVAEGATASLGVDASAASGGFTYRWFEEEWDEDGNWIEDKELPGETGKTFTTPAISGHRGKDAVYFCRVSDKYGNSVWVYFYIQNADIVIYADNKVISEGQWVTAGKYSRKFTLKTVDGTPISDPEWEITTHWSAKEGMSPISIDSNGTVKANCVGEATLTAFYKDFSQSTGFMVLFSDVTNSDDYYYDPVYWAARNGVTTGTSPSTFAPGKSCTRGQIVTFLWRAYGSPEPGIADNPFTDVKSDAYYYDAVLWAVENDITTGTSPTTFAPNNACTRGHIVTFLWRAAGSPEPTLTTNPFKDVKPGAFYYKAVLWAVENGITTGTSATTFEPNKSCTRGQCVTFLMRAVVGTAP